MIKKSAALFGMLVLSFVVVGCGGGDAPVKATMDGPRDPNMKPMIAGKGEGAPAPIADVIEKP